MSRIITWHDKHADRHYHASTRDELHKAALTILGERLEHGYLVWPDEAEAEARAILDAEDGAKAWEFLRERDDFEYEGISEGTVG